MSAAVAEELRLGAGPATSGSTDDPFARGEGWVDGTADAWPWTRRSLALMLVPAVIGAGWVVAGYVGSSREPDWTDQLPWVVLSVGGAALAALGMVWWLLRALRAVRREQRQFRSDVNHLAARVESTAPSSSSASGVPTYVYADGMSRYHRPECLLAAASKNLRTIVGADLSSTGLKRCEVCGS